MAEQLTEQWTAEIDEHRAANDWYEAAIWTGIPLTRSHQVVARVCSVEPTYDEDAQDLAKARAHIIAAAPEMLAVLESLYVDLVDYSKRLEGAYSTGSIALASCADQVRAVLQKAKGISR